MSQDLTGFDAALKDDYQPVIVDLINNEIPLLEMFTKNGDRSLAADGRQVLYPIHYGRNSGAGAVGEKKTLPTAGNQQLAQVKIPYRYNYGRIELSEQVIDASKSSKGAFKKAMQVEMDGMIQDVARQMNRQLYGFGVGIACRVNGQQTTSTTLVVKAALGVSGTGDTNPARFLRPNDYITFVRNATPTSATDSDIVPSAGVVQVSSISADGTTITLVGAFGATLNDNDMVVFSPANATGESSVNKEVMGLLGIVDDGTYVSTLFNIARTSVPAYKSSVITLGGNLDIRLLQRVDDLIYETSGMECTDLISHTSVREEYLNLLMNAKRFVNEGGKSADAGWDGAAIKKAIAWSEKPWKVDRMAPYGTLFFLNKPSNVRYVNCEGEWADRDGTILLRTLNKDTYEARWRRFENFHNDKPFANARIDSINLTKTLDIVPVF